MPKHRFPSRPRAFVTGAASGFGRAIALDLAARRGRLVLGDIDDTGLAETAELVERRGGEVRTIRCDVRDPDQVEAQVALADEAFGGVDIGVNNAGVAVAGPVGDVTLEDWKWQIDINLWGVIYGCHALVPRMKAQGSGWILNVASAAGIASAPTMGPYNVSKAGVISLTETLCGELMDTGVSASALCPTFFQTNIHTRARTTMPHLRDQTAKLITESKWTAAQVAEIALDQLEKGTLYIIPQPDARGLWRAKRALGGRFFQLMGKAMKNPRFMKVLGGE
ncbi:MAG: SDR family NAD(P)-dependent oxidoreductase [Sandaracinaceae bacterium]|nr:SDR family NAD(P)-dependent oxidoreductase [Sandaracinaceae bacterium]